MFVCKNTSFGTQEQSHEHTYTFWIFDERYLNNAIFEKSELWRTLFMKNDFWRTTSVSKFSVHPDLEKIDMWTRFLFMCVLNQSMYVHARLSVCACVWSSGLTHTYIHTHIWVIPYGSDTFPHVHVCFYRICKLQGPNLSKK